MTIHPSPYDIIRAIEDQQAVIDASQKATARLVKMLTGMLDASAPEPLLTFPTRSRAASPAASKKNATPDGLTAAQNEAAAGSIPEQGADERAAGDGEAISAQSAQFVTLAGEGEGVGAPADPSPAAEPVSDLAPAPPAVAEARPPEVLSPLPPPPADEALSPEKLAAVDVIAGRVFGPGGDIFVNTRAARALHVLRHGDLFGFDHVALKAKIPSASDCRHALRLEEASLRSIGLEVWTDKLNARLREAA